MHAHVRIVRPLPDPPATPEPSAEEAPLKARPNGEPLCPTCGRHVQTQRPATYCRAACRARASRERREIERQRELGGRLALAEALLGQLAGVVADLRLAVVSQTGTTS